MAKEPIGKLDHIGIAVKNLAEARKFWEEIMGARFLYESENQEDHFKFCELDLSGVIIELLEPTAEASFLGKFMAKRGEGLHHLTLRVTDTQQKAAALKQKGVRVIDETEWSPTSYEAYISPRSANGVLIQLGSGYPTLSDDPAWLDPKSLSGYRDLTKPKE
ncbi:MAG: VOC family protein [Candidatus Binataceae bacterium]|jgi:methylmalonyl-CoA epimerase